jgi:hypothetical protein
MTTPTEVRVTNVPPPPLPAKNFIRWICTHNPFYIISAGLFFAGLRISFGDVGRSEDTWGLMGGLAGYLLLLAATACLLVRFGNVWEDVRSVLLLVVLMFLATSVTFDEVLVVDPERGKICYLVGLALAVGLSEVLLRGMRLVLPALFRVPYYLILGLFFLYPVAIRPLVECPATVEMMWGLYAFSAVAGVVFLTLLPAIRRGPDYVRFNGSPWRWPLFPWVLFGLLAAAVPARALLLCWSMLLPEGRQRAYLIFGPYFLIPFGLAITILLLEVAIVAKSRGGMRAVLIVAAGLLLLAEAGRPGDPLYTGFLREFTIWFGGGPFWTTLVALSVFYAYALIRRAPLAAEALTAALAMMAFVAPKSSDSLESVTQMPVALLAAAGLQLVLGIWKRSAARCLMGCGCLVAVVALTPMGDRDGFLRTVAAFHAGLISLMVLGAVFDNALGRHLRVAAAFLAQLASVAVLIEGLHRPGTFPEWIVWGYPVGMAVIIAGYGALLRHRLSLVVAGFIGFCALVAAGWRGYVWLRTFVVGLDLLAVSLFFFALAVLISLGKAGFLRRLMPEGWGGPPPWDSGPPGEIPSSERVMLPEPASPVTPAPEAGVTEPVSGG